jgi:hypothetical protein
MQEAYSVEELVFSNYKMRSFRSFREQGIWVYFSSRMVHSYVQRMMSLTSCMMCLVHVSCRIDSRNASSVGVPGHHVHRTWILAIISFRATLKTTCTAPICTLFKSCKRKIKLLLKRLRDIAWHSWKICGSFMASPRSRRISLWTRVHMKVTCTQTLDESELSFIYHVVLYSTK